jgi:Tfp pilus assembly protein PilZ
MPKAVRPGSSRLTAEQLNRVRVPFVQRATLVHGPEREELFLVDLGVSGAFAERAEPLPVGDRVTLTFPLPGNERPIRAVCRVAWWHPQAQMLVSKSLPSGVGLEFVEVSEQDGARLRQHLLDYLGRETMGRRFHRVRPVGEGGDAP